MAFETMSISGADGVILEKIVLFSIQNDSIMVMMFPGVAARHQMMIMNEDSKWF